MQVKEPYPSDLTESEWKLIRPLIPSPRLFGRPPRYEKRAILNAMFYIVRSGCSWRLLPHDMPPWRIVYHYFMVWRQSGLWQKLHDTLREKVRLKSGKKKPRALRSSILRALKHLTTEECAAMMLERRSWDENDTSWWTRWA